MTVYANSKQTNRVYRAMATAVERANDNGEQTERQPRDYIQRGQLIEDLRETQRLLREASAQIDALTEENAQLREQLGLRDTITIPEYARRHGIHRSTAWRRVKSGKVAAEQDASGRWHVYV